ncbi:MAG: response regulator transcription factor [Croceitalea sp.]|nr:LytTR family DNA-binding domain-containing protein [Croceitalea sp.]MBT8238160.1 LytTR family DNA-binding domain-containing protein [Croceitalea sp.]NNC33630.1 response regulator transcription factor [Croceitalea sp.]NNL09392.1 response regulator transcription factor [Croceitalea sp.]NNM17466.1 response regulator transcription factor [Croceitalea sp.]
MKCIIIDDELSAREIVAQLCRSADDLQVLELFPNAIEALKFLNQNEVDLIFLDIHMPMLTGFDFIETLKNPPKIVLTSSDKNFAIDAYEYDFIVDYLMKPINCDRFSKTLSKIRKAFEQGHQDFKGAPKRTDLQNEDLFINIDRRLIKLKLGDILMIEAKGDYIVIKTTDTSYKVHSTLKKIKEKLPDSLFMQIHRSFIINYTKIIDIQDNSVLIDRSVIPISRSNRPNLIQRLNLL